MNGKTVKEKIILGIDPGTNIMGYGIIKITGTRMEMLSMGVLDMSALDDHPAKLRRIFERTLALVEEFTPDELAIEAPFFGKNVQSMLKLGRAQGVAMAAGLYRDIPIFEYSPRKIKQSITGNGNASKEQVAAMIANLFKIKTLPKDLDATDGIAAAVCHHFQFKAVTGQASSFTGWKAFLNANPDKLKKK